jgi:hypothetical protein
MFGYGHGYPITLGNGLHNQQMVLLDISHPITSSYSRVLLVFIQLDFP